MSGDTRMLFIRVSENSAFWVNKSTKVLFGLAFSFFVAITLTHTSAATITHSQKTASRSSTKLLVMRIDGPIAPGDAETVKDIVRNSGLSPFNDYHDIVAVLNSPGGNLSAGLELMKVFRELNVSTYVGEGAECLSACALAFMAGTRSSAQFRTSDRRMHPKARVGFHAPSLNLPAQGKVPIGELNRAYAAALSAVARVVSKMEALGIEESLIETMLNTPPQDMYTIRTINDVNRWKIKLDVANDRPSPSRRQVVTLCNSYQQWARGLNGVDTAKYANYAASQVRQVRYQKLREANDDRTTVASVTVNEENGNTCYLLINSEDTQTPFEVLFSTSSRRAVLAAIQTRNIGFQSANYAHTFAPETPIRTLRAASNRLEIKDGRDDPNYEQGFCEWFEGLRRVEIKPCEKFLKDFVFVYERADGQTTTLDPRGNTARLDGEASSVVTKPGGRVCQLKNSTSRAFCFSPKRLKYSEPRRANPPNSTPGRFAGACRDQHQWMGELKQTGKVTVSLRSCGSGSKDGTVLEINCVPDKTHYDLVGFSIRWITAAEKRKPHIYMVIGRMSYILDNATIKGTSDPRRSTVHVRLPKDHNIIETLAFEKKLRLGASGLPAKNYHLNGSSNALAYLERCG